MAGGSLPQPWLLSPAISQPGYILQVLAEFGIAKGTQGNVCKGAPGCCRALPSAGYCPGKGAPARKGWERTAA